MALIHEYTLLCEMARPEIGGKFTIVGLFPNGIGLLILPFPMPILSFYNALRADSPGTYRFTGRLSSLEGGPPLAQAQGVIQANQTGPFGVPVQFQNVRFTATGTYTWSLEIEGQDGPFLTQFQVAVVVPPQQAGFPVQNPRI